MRILVLNLPFEKPIIRRYSCSYYAHGFLYEPHELLRVATILKEGKNEILFLDCIAEKKNITSTIEYIKKKRIDLIITMLGIDFVTEDYKTITTIKKNCRVKIVGISYIASLFPEMFKNLDVILNKFFEEKIANAKNETTLDRFLKKLKIDVKEKNPDIIKKVDRSFLNFKDYTELLTSKCAFIYFGFGCPFKCNYCIRSYDLNEYKIRSKEFVFDELKTIFLEGYRNVRIMDDNFTLNSNFLMELSEFLKKENIHLNFYGLSRIDLLNDKTIELLRRINVKRLYIGLETFKQDMQKYYDKNIKIDIEKFTEIFKKLRSSKIETGVWLLYHPIKDRKEEILDWINILLKLNPDFVNLSIITPYPNTLFFEMEKSNFVFSINPFKSEFSITNYEDVEKEFFRRYLFHPKNILKHIKLAIRNPNLPAELLLDLLSKKRTQRKDLI
ncbi:MAG: radical SAM protein [Candidatus Woesearchaeota archaeon]